MSNDEKVIEEKKSGLCTAGLVLGIIGVCTSFMPIINNLSFVMGILAIVFALISLKKAGKGKFIATIILGVLTICFTLSAQQSLSDSFNQLSDDLNNSLSDLNGDNTESILANDVDVQIGDFTVEKGDFLDNTKLTVTITNKTSEVKSFSILIEAVDSNNVRIDQETIYASSINPGQSIQKDIFTFVSSDNIEKLKNATFKVVEVSKY